MTKSLAIKPTDTKGVVAGKTLIQAGMLAGGGVGSALTEAKALQGVSKTLVNSGKASEVSKIDFIATSSGVAVHKSQKEMINSIENVGAIYVGPARSPGTIHLLETPEGTMVIRAMKGEKGNTGYNGIRTVITTESPSKYIYPNGKDIKGAVSKSDRRAIGHIHGQTE